MHLRLSAMMFMQYAVPACFAPILSLYLKNNLGFTPVQVGWVLAITAMGAVLAPVLASYVADRLIPARLMLVLCHVLAGSVMLTLSFQKSFLPFLWLYFVYGLVFLPSHGLSNTVAFHHVSDVKRDFGSIRLWGTVGWVFVAWTFGLFWLGAGENGGPDPRLPHALRLCAGISFTLAAYSLTLPRVACKTGPRASIVPWEAFRVFARPSVAVLCIVTLFTSMIHQHYYYGMSIFMRQLDVPENHIMALMSIGQFSEVIVMWFLGRALARFGMKRVILIGLCAQLVRYCVFALGQPFSFVVAALANHGFCYAFFFTAGYLYIDEHSSAEARAGAQQIYTALIMGVGFFLGHTTGGWLGRWFTIAGTTDIDFQKFWAVPGGIAMVIIVFFFLFFREEKGTPAKET
jgi:nucleoside transporter